MKTAWLAGASGMVGQQLLQQMLDDSALSVVALGRRRVERTHERLLQVQLDFTDATAFDALPAPDLALCSLGTTRKKAGSAVAFRAVDFDAVRTFAQAARRRGALTFLHVSSIGANPRSRTLYTAVKGEIEEAVAGLGFDSCYAFRPSILDGRRAESRPLEHLGLMITRVLAPVLGPYRPTPATAVAQAMLAAAREPRPGAHIVEAGTILAASGAAL
ncbi:MAG: NAD(P)H-binding protein [Pseudomonadota bacterium]